MDFSKEEEKKKDRLKSIEDFLASQNRFTGSGRGVLPEETEEYDPSAIIEAMREEYFESLEEEEDIQSHYETTQLLGFRLGQENFAVKITDLKSVIRIPRITRLPLSPPHLRGIINMRGEIKPVVNLHPLFNLNEKDEDEKSRILIVHEKIRNVALLADEILDLYEVYLDDIQPPLDIQTQIPANYLQGKIEIEEQLVLLLELSSLLHSEELKIRTK